MTKIEQENIIKSLKEILRIYREERFNRNQDRVTPRIEELIYEVRYARSDE